MSSPKSREPRYAGFTRFSLAATTILAGVVGLASCREPTQITLELTTDLPCPAVVANGGVEIRVGSADGVEGTLAQQVVAPSCVDGRIGSLVIVPSDSVDDQVAIFVTVGATTKTATCSRQTPTGCVLGRRVLRYVPHTRLQLPIELDASCIDKACAPDQTCNKGQCQSAAVACDGNGLCNVPPPADAGAPDTGVPDAACSGSQANCGGGCVDVATDPVHCGACNIACNGQCAGGICRLLTPSAMVDQPGATGCLVTAGNPPEVYWTQRPVQTPAGVYRVDRNGSNTLPPAVEAPITADLGGIAAGNGRVVYGVTTSGLAVIHDFQTTTHVLDPTPLASLVSAGHVANVAVSPGAPNRACWTTLTDGMVRCTGWAMLTAVNALNPGEAAALGPSVVAVGLAAAIFPVDAVAGANSASAGGLAAVRGVSARTDSNVFYYTEGPALKVLTATSFPSVGIGTLDSLTNPGLGIAYDALTEAIYWVEDDASNGTSIHSRPVVASGTQKTLTTGQHGANCIAVDDQAVYWLSNGVPYKMPK